MVCVKSGLDTEKLHFGSKTSGLNSQGVSLNLSGLYSGMLL